MGKPLGERRLAGLWTDKNDRSSPRMVMGAIEEMLDIAFVSVSDILVYSFSAAAIGILLQTDSGCTLPCHSISSA